MSWRSTLIKLMQLILPVVLSPPVQFKGTHTCCRMPWWGFFLPHWTEMESGSWDMQTTLRQPVCNGMLVPLYCHLFSLPHPASLHGLHLMWNMGDRPLFSSKVRTSLFLSPFVDPRGLEICITVPLSFQVIWGRAYSKAGDSVENRFENVSVHGLSSFLNPTGGHVARYVTSATWKHPPQHCRSQKKKKRNRLLLVFCCLF